MTTALATAPKVLAPMPKEQLDLIKKTVAAGATNDELALFLYDCQRRGVHPLDKLIHFTVRKDKSGGRKYTPITSIDFMRTQAALSGEMAGSDDAVFKGEPEERTPPTSATVTVYRFTQGQRFPYTATARWSEYKPDQDDFMWRRMPHTMLGKCAEALALRKAFPQQLAGLYAREEMEQADGPKGYVVEPIRPSSSEVERHVEAVRVAGSIPALAPIHADIEAPPPPKPIEDDGPDFAADVPEGAVLIRRVDVTVTSNPNVKKHLITDSNGETFSTIREQLASLCEQLCQEKLPVTIESKPTKWGKDLVAVHRVERVIQMQDDIHGAPLSSDDIPF